MISANITELIGALRKLADYCMVASHEQWEYSMTALYEDSDDDRDDSR
jgi:predicted secreted protein